MMPQETQKKLQKKFSLKNNDSQAMLNFSFSLQSSLFCILHVNTLSTAFDVRETERESEKDYQDSMSQRSSYSSHTKMPIFTHIRKWKFLREKFSDIIFLVVSHVTSTSPNWGISKCMNDNSSGKLKISLTLAVDVAVEQMGRERGKFILVSH